MGPSVFFTVTREGVAPSNYNQILTMLRSKYTSSNDPIQNARLLLDAQRDSWYVAFSLWTAAQLAAHDVNVYVYSFNHRSANLGVTPAGAVQLGAPHGQQEVYLFGAPMSAHDYSDQEAELSLTMMRTWTTFAATG